MKRFKNLPMLLVILIGFIPLFDLFYPGLPLTHDGQDHVARIANFYQDLTEGNIIPRWAGNLNWGYGHPILMFLYPLPSYASSLFHFLGFSLIDSTKIVFGIAFLLSGLTMYLWVRNFLGELPGLVSGVLFMFAPYRFVDMYVRGAIGEHVAFVFVPLILYFLLKISKISHYYRYTSISLIVGGALSVAGLILSHNAISLMFMPIILFYALYLTFTSEESIFHVSTSKESFGHLRGVVAMALLGFGLSAFFWIPAFFEGKYTLRDIVTAGEYASRFTDFSRFVYSSWSFGGSGEFSLQVGIINWLALIFSVPVIYFLYKKKNHLWILGSVFFLIFWLTIFLMTPLSKLIWEYVTVLQKFQFPWRFMSITVFSIAVLGGLIIYSLPNKFKSYSVFFLVILLLFFNKDYWKANGYLQKPEGFFTGIYNGTTDTGESSPIWSVRFMEKRPTKNIEVISGEADIKEINRNSTIHVYEIDAVKKSRILENTLYFPGWVVFVDGRKAQIEFQDPQFRGLMTFFVDKGKHNVEIKFGETKLRLFADIITVTSLAVIISYPLLNLNFRSTIKTK